MKKQTAHGDEKYSLKGTFVSVMIVGAVIVVGWLGIFILFITRG